MVLPIEQGQQCATKLTRRKCTSFYYGENIPYWEFQK